MFLKKLFPLKNKKQKMKRSFFPFWIAFVVIGIFGCSARQKFLSNYEKNYEVADHGNFNAVVHGSACAITLKEAQRQAQKTASFHLQTVIGAKRYRTHFQEIEHTNNGRQFCVTTSAVATPY